MEIHNLKKIYPVNHMSIERPFFSIIVPVYNEERYIREALDSILLQTDTDWEAILVDDGSTDSTPLILAEYAKKDFRFRYFHKINGGTSTAINLGVKKAQGEWFCWLSGDDLFHPQKLEFHRRAIQNHPDTLFFSTGYWIILPNGKTIEYSDDWLELGKPAYHLMQLLRGNWVMGISVCIKREAWLNEGELDARLHYAQDLDMWVRLMLNTSNHYLPERTCTMRQHPGQDTAKFPFESLFDAAKILIRLLNKHSFKDLFPAVNMNDRDLALDMLRRTLDFVASESSAYVYKLGVHPLLHLRILEWIWDPSTDSTLKNDLCSLFVDRASDFLLHLDNSPFSMLWRATYAALRADQPSFAYFPCEAGTIGEINYYIQRAQNSEVAEPLGNYLIKNENLSFANPLLNIDKPGQLILLLPPEVSLDDFGDDFQKIKEIWRYLNSMGFFVLLVGKSKYTMGSLDGFLFLGAEDQYEQDKLLASLGDLDTVVALSNSERLKWLRAERLVFFDLYREKISSSELLAGLIHKIRSTPKKLTWHLVGTKILDFLRITYNLVIPAPLRTKIEFTHRFRSLRASLKPAKFLPKNTRD
jgi:hypothetical protein